MQIDQLVHVHPISIVLRCFLLLLWNDHGVMVMSELDGLDSFPCTISSHEYRYSCLIVRGRLGHLCNLGRCKFSLDDKFAMEKKKSRHAEVERAK